MGRVDYGEKAAETESWKARGLVLHWVVQRSTLTGVLITFVDFEDYADAERHKDRLEAIADPLGYTNVVAIETLPNGELPKIQTNGAASARQLD
jgi:hypothetical protein